MTAEAIEECGEFSMGSMKKDECRATVFGCIL
jgi:hypothetical protein